MQIGAMVGTVMVANVFFVIIPVQKKLVEACETGGEGTFEFVEREVSAQQHGRSTT